jgi:hypothetical protein
MKQVASKVDFHQTAWLYIPEDRILLRISKLTSPVSDFMKNYSLVF